ncbi:hypothetical protein [Halovenus amylolytica]
MPTVRTFDMPDLESRLVGRPEGERDNSIAFPQFFTAGFTHRRPFPEH